jgi:hypothetical protein
MENYGTKLPGRVPVYPVRLCAWSCERKIYGDSAVTVSASAVETGARQTAAIQITIVR